MKIARFLKRNLVAVAALGILLGAAAFSTKPANQKLAGQYTFEFQGQYIAGEVQNLSNWKYIGMDQAQCSNDDVKACRIFAASADVDISGPSPVLNASTVSVTEFGSAPNIHVSGISGSALPTYSNKLN